MNGGPVGSRVADSLDQLGLSGWDGIKKTFPEATLRFFRKPGEPFAADPLGLESFELAYGLLAAKINDCECAVLHRKTPRQRPRFWRARHDQINPFGDFVVDAGASAALWFVLRVLQVFAQDDFGYPADDREFFRRKSLRHERPRSWPEVFGLGAGRSGQEGTLVREHVAQMIERRRVKARRQRCGCSLEFPPSQQRCAG